MFASTSEGLGNIHIQSLDDEASTPLLPVGDGPRWRADWSPDEGSVAYEQTELATRSDIWIVDVDGGTPRLFRQSAADDLSPRFSPDGRWIAYESDESGRFEIYVGSVSELGVRELVSGSGGRNPFWSRDGSELFYEQDEMLMAVPMETRTRGIELEAPEPLFSTTDLSPSDVSPDGSRFLAVQQPEIFINLIRVSVEPIVRGDVPGQTLRAR